MSNKFQVPSSLTLEPNPFEQSFAGKSGTQSSDGSQQQSQRLPSVQEMTSPAPLLATPGQWQGVSLVGGARLSPAILTGHPDMGYQQPLPSPAVLQSMTVPQKNAAANGLYMLSRDNKEKRDMSGVGMNDRNSKRKRSKKEEESKDDDEDKRRKYFLERNRIAAVKCRQRKKQWVDNLKNKVDYYMTVNEELVAEVTKLRSNLEQVKQFVYTSSDPRRLPPPIQQIFETPPAPLPTGPPDINGAPGPATGGASGTPGIPQPQQPLATQGSQGTQMKMETGQHRQGQEYQNVVLMVPQQMMIPPNRPS